MKVILDIPDNKITALAALVGATEKDLQETFQELPEEMELTEAMADQLDDTYYQQLSMAAAAVICYHLAKGKEQ